MEEFVPLLKYTLRFSSFTFTHSINTVVKSASECVMLKEVLEMDKYHKCNSVYIFVLCIEFNVVEHYVCWH